ncbi:hypothetical protein KAM644c_08040 [Klebsiella quasipneumoniae subsp. quasipneumoniae]|uniref:Uncharacterized protein n=1 Tax=Klebsiella quasipneumoniae subsp. quasipneumoniae TaxID=1667327 RepID=A0AAN2CC38_9ENTR|nr:hypothetical protein TMSI_08700 [Klebsiella quasipneumoniae]BDO01228.1 hypothetical protein KAM622c_08150 [Klebsiella quasipneumoniae subsp. quasipneumoniae]BDO11738.1 hypothetical protein KAM644c_08040 [Klebsiella quasipneumoniae subsp. quasipneumoniae]BDO17715.1 hypothetical protein KAM645c_08050 [Klebsiella quasipneumoniae subsp. quasipneumoniae]GKO51377.1 hypothetical protein NUBL21974_39830 [Klebsiella quasipneumoniae]
MSKNAPPNKQKNQPGNAAPNTGIAGESEQPVSGKTSSSRAGRAMVAI